MKLILSAAAIVVLAINLIDGSFDYRGFNPWDHKPDLPDGFFTILRIIVSLDALFSAHLYYKLHETGLSDGIIWSAIFGFIVILFQPMFPVHFEYETWLFIDLAVLIFIASELYFSIWIGRRVLGGLQEDAAEALELDVQSPNAQPRASTNLPQKLVYKSGQAFLKYQCKFGHTKIEPNQEIIALVVDSAKEFGVAESVQIEADGRQMAMLKVASVDGGFFVPAYTPTGNGDRLKPDDVVIWVPHEYVKPTVDQLDPRIGWVGFIVAKVKPEIDLAKDSFDIVCRYDK